MPQKAKANEIQRGMFFIFPPEISSQRLKNKSQERNAEQNGLSKHSHEVARISFAANETKTKGRQGQRAEVNGGTENRNEIRESIEEV